MAGFFDLIGSIAQPITSVVNGITSLGSSLINRHSQKETNKKNQEINNTNNAFNAEQAEMNRLFQQKEAQKERDYNALQAQLARDAQRNLTLELFNKTNEYNSPSNQLKLLEKAGINPNSFNMNAINADGIIGSSPASAQQNGFPAGSPANAAPPLGMSSPQISNPIMDMAQIRLANAQARSLEHETERKDELQPYEVKTADANYQLTLANTELTKSQKLEVDKNIEQINSNIMKLEQDVRTSSALERLYDSQNLKTQQEYDAFGQEFAKRMIQYDKQFEVYQKEIEKFGSEIAKNYALAREASANAALAGSQTQLNKDSHILNGIQIEFNDKNHDAIMAWKWNTEKMAYDVTMSEGKSSLTRSRYYREQHKWKDWREQNWSNPVKYTNFMNERIQFFGEAAGTVFGGNMNMTVPSKPKP